MSRQMMDALEIASFLESQHTGVLAMADDDDSYAIPVSFAYDEGDQSVYLRLGYAPGSQKRRYIDASRHVSFVVYDRTDEGWKSVVAKGRLEEIAKTDIESAIIERLMGLDIPYVEVHDRPVDEIQFVVAHINVADLTGVVEG